MDAILFSSNPITSRVPPRLTVKDAIKHLAKLDKLYWSVGFPIKRDKFSFPILGFIHIKERQVEYKVKIEDIIPFSPELYKNTKQAERVKPKFWITGWNDWITKSEKYLYETDLVIIKIEPFFYDTYKFLKFDGSPVKNAPQGYIRVLPPEELGGPSVDSTQEIRPDTLKPAPAIKGQKAPLAEKNLEDLIIHRLEEIESGLRLEKRQLSTDAGRLDILCKDRDGWYVVIELKRTQATDQVVGQILRYMGWVRENYQTDKVRGIIIVGKKDIALSYAVKAVPNIQVKEFKISIE